MKKAFLSIVTMMIGSTAFALENPGLMTPRAVHMNCKSSENVAFHGLKGTKLDMQMIFAEGEDSGVAVVAGQASKKKLSADIVAHSSNGHLHAYQFHIYKSGQRVGELDFHSERPGAKGRYTLALLKPSEFGLKVSPRTIIADCE